MQRWQKDGIKAVNQDFIKYDQVNKEHEYRLVEDQEQDLFDEEYVIPVCDMRMFFDGNEVDKKRFAHQFGSALEGIGFAVLEGHGVNTTLYEKAYLLVRKIFEKIPLNQRLKYRAERFGSVNQGYFPIKKTTIIHPDLVEGWVFCRRAFDLDADPNYREQVYWPEVGLEPIFREIVSAHEALILPIMQSILVHLNCDPNLYDDKLIKPNFGFRLNYYPAISAKDDATGSGRMLGHEDVDLFTLLPAQEIEGLQVYNQKNGKWIRLNPPPGSIILNTGDYMQRITNDRLPSTTHRVSKPASKRLHEKPRISIPMAIYFWEEEILEVLPSLKDPKYDPITALKFHTNITSKYYGDDYAVND